MAYSEEQWNEAKAYFEIGKSLSFIESKTGINKASISRKSKKDNWEKGKTQQLKSDIVGFEQEKATLDNKKATLLDQIATLDNNTITIMEEVVNSEVELKTLLFSTSTLAIVRNNQILTKGKKTVMLKVAQYEGGQRAGEDFEPYEVDLSPSDIKDCVDGTDKAAITLNLADRHAPKTEIINTNATQNNTKRVTIARRSDRRDD